MGHAVPIKPDAPLTATRCGGRRDAIARKDLNQIRNVRLQDGL